MVWNPFHIALAVVYIASLLLVGVLTGRRRRDSNQFLNATGAFPLWVCIAAAIAANCGSLDVIAMMALGAQYGMLACHFYWIGAIPALVVLVFWLLPAYARERFPTVLDFISRYYGPETRAAVALGMAAMMLLLAGVCLCATAQVATSFLGWNFLSGVLLTAALVLFYTWMGGLRATVYNELLHFAVVLAAILPLGYFVVRDFGGVRSLISSIPSAKFHVWQTLPWISPHAVMDRFGVILGLGLVLSFGYWSTDFVLMQRALAVRRAEDVQYVPLALAAAKLIFAMLIVVPGVIAPLVLHLGTAPNWNATLPAMMLHYYNPWWVVIGITGLAASLVSTFANNVSGFSAAWMQGVYRPWIYSRGSESHYLWMGRIANAAAVLLSIGGAHVALEYHSLMEYMQMIFAAFNGPVFALVALAALAPRRAAGGGVAGFVLGLASAVLHQALVHAGVLRYGSLMTANFYAAVLSFGVAAVSTLIAARVNRRKRKEPGLISEPVRLSGHFSAPIALAALAILLVGIACNAIFR
ncbi:putative SSS sodium solute transporter superfamily [Candidatus Sulfotelmatobacter kueseliae]|uniref:Putative SSS sodium solute transporter superfamily n=1 Tax=Candidatus Sulfotelmatobacter kueseliae TaxID=2042962 RepID=A0A2U3KFH2_9BACT|nr:putative SSS sodium solute transporter superfamily [Candidatus Sulfotelmatobacter kueseliae]